MCPETGNDSGGSESACCLFRGYSRSFQVRNRCMQSAEEDYEQWVSIGHLSAGGLMKLVRGWRVHIESCW